MLIKALRPISAAIAAHDASAAIDAIETALDGETGPAWNRELRKLADVIRTDSARFTIFARDGNSKLPFVAWSSLPGEGFCAGAGECLKFCYSFKAHRYPAAYARQAQNSWLLASATGREAILEALDTFEPKGFEPALDAGLRVVPPVDFRLYVDGDFTSVADVAFWFTALRARPWLRAYGYSKSFREILAYDGLLPTNYKLNLSSGHRHGPGLVRAMAALSITRGEFVAVSIGRKVSTSDHGTRAHNAVLRAAYGAKAFTCPGKCGSCTPTGHACGSERFAGVPIIIATH